MRLEITGPRFGSLNGNANLLWEGGPENSKRIVGGDNCHRGSLLGALLGAAGGTLPARLAPLHEAEATSREVRGFARLAAGASPAPGGRVDASA